MPTCALTNADSSVFRLNISVPAMDRLDGATINAIGVCWGTIPIRYTRTHHARVRCGAERPNNG